MSLSPEEIRNLAQRLDDQKQSEERTQVLLRIGFNPKQRKRPSGPPKLRVLRSAPLLPCDGFQSKAMSFYPS